VVRQTVNPDAALLSYFAWILQKSNQNEEELKIIRRAIELEPENAKFRWLEAKFSA
jgi:hypothetical protein